MKLKVQVALWFVLLLLVGAAITVFNRRVDYEVWKQSAQYNIGTTNDLYDLRDKFVGAQDAGEKTVLKSTFIRRARAYGVDKLPPDLQAFYYGNQ